MRVSNLHRWDLDIPEAVRLQHFLSGKVSLTGKIGALRFVAGCDVGYSLTSGALFGGAVLWDLENFEIIEERVVEDGIPFPYISGLLSFREAPVLLKALERLSRTPDAILVDGQGIAHPRGLGLASHIGLHVDAPVVGCAKTRLFGDHKPVDAKKGSFCWLRCDDLRIGAVLRTRTNVKPVYVSPGNRIEVSESLRVVSACTGRFRLPEPIRAAHRLVQSRAKQNRCFKATLR